MDSSKQIQFSQQAGSNPQAVALVNLDTVLASHPEGQGLRRAVEAAATPHWFDEGILQALLDEDQRGDAAHWFSLLCRLPAVEPCARRGGFNVDEATRLALRRRLATQFPYRFATLTARSVDAFSGDSVPFQIERAFHRLSQSPDSAVTELRGLYFNLRSNVEHGLELADCLSEYMADESWPPLVRGWAFWLNASVREPFLTIPERLALAEGCKKCFDVAGLDYPLALGHQLLGQILLERGQLGDAEAALDLFQRCHEVLECVLAGNPSSAEAARDVAVSLIKLGDFLSSRGQFGDAETALGHYQRSHEVFEGLLAANPDSAQAARDLSVSLDRLGECLSNRGWFGDAEAALGLYQRSLEVSERLLAANPDSAQAARDLSLSLIQLGDCLLRRGQFADWKAALGHYQRSLEVSERLLAANPGNTQAARDVAVSLNKLGDFLLRRGQPGDTEAALGLYQRSHEVLEGLLATNPESAQAERDVFVSLIKLGDFLLYSEQLGDAEAALGLYQRSLEVSERLLAANPDSAQAARDVSVSLDRLGEYLFLYGHSGDAEAALGLFQRCLEVSERLLAANPDSVQAASDVAVSFIHLGDFLSSRGQPGDTEAALGLYQRCHEVFEGRLAANPGSAEAARNVAVSLDRLGDCLFKRGQPGDAEAALGHYQRSLEVRERLLAANPDSAEAARDVAMLHYRIYQFHIQRGDTKAAPASLEQCFAILDAFAREGRPMDAELRELYDQLTPLFFKG